MRIGVAGSMQFTDKMYEICDELAKLGHEPFMSGFGPRYRGKSAEEIEVLKLEDKNGRDAIREFWEPMQSADALLVLNYDKNGIANYIGGNAFLEIGFAHVLQQKIFFMNPIPQMPHYHTELVAMKPTVIHGDLTKII